ncbi:MAG: hypothetical protein QOJ16_4074, partial [Acidobacteriota bacterium]|nr:hypothetical protein [Acidobacteriota bacterium]
VRGRSSADRTTRWDVLVTNLKPSLPEMPHVVDDLKALEEMLAQARALETQQEDLRSQARKSNSQLQKLLVAGDRIRSRLGSTLKGKLGFTDVALSKYGFKPIPTVRKRKSATPPAATGTAGKPAPAPHGTTPAVPATPGTPTGGGK